MASRMMTMAPDVAEEAAEGVLPGVATGHPACSQAPKILMDNIEPHREL